MPRTVLSSVTNFPQMGLCPLHWTYLRRMLKSQAFVQGFLFAAKLGETSTPLVLQQVHREDFPPLFYRVGNWGSGSTRDLHKLTGGPDITPILQHGSQNIDNKSGPAHRWKPAWNSTLWISSPFYLCFLFVRSLLSLFYLYFGAWHGLGLETLSSSSKIGKLNDHC